jgi:hypothetical protein
MNYRRSLSLIGTACIGAGAMFLADPRTGKRRRALIRDQFTSANKKIGRFIAGRSEDVKNRAHGLYCEVKSLVGNACEPTGSTRQRRRA